MRRAGDRVRPILSRLGLKSGLELALVRQKWASLFPGPLAKHAAPSNLEGGTLTVTADSSAWVQQLSFLKPQMLEKLSVLGVEDIRFRLGRVTQPMERHDDPPVKPTKEDMEFVETVLAGIRDPELSESVRAALQEWIRRPSKHRHSRPARENGSQGQKKP